MKKSVILLITSILLVVNGLNDVAYAEDTFVEKFISSPLLILAGLLVVLAVAIAYHKIQR